MSESVISSWRALEEQTEQREQQLGSAHEVQRFHRDVDETRDWIQEKVTQRKRKRDEYNKTQKRI